MKKLIFLISLVFISGCVTLTSNPRYIQTYPTELNNIWANIKKVPLKKEYSYKIVSSKDTTLPGVPQINGNQILLSDTFIDYVYKYYYNYSARIFLCLFLHEICHTEYGLNDKPPETHYLVDKQAINLLPNLYYDIKDYYNFLVVLESYADSLIAGKKFINTMRNVVNLATYLYIGFGTYQEFSYDVNIRRNMLRKEYPNSKFTFKRSSFSKSN